MSKKLFIALISMLVLLSACSSSGASGTSADGELLELNVAIFPYSSHLPIYIAEQEGYFTEEGLDITYIRFTATSDALVALIQGRIDVTASTLTEGTFKAMAEGSGVRYVADKGYLNESSCTNTAWLVRTEIIESGILDDLGNIANLNISYRDTNSAFNFAMDQLLEPIGLSSEDLHISYVPVGNLVEAFSQGTVDVTGTGEPWVSRIVNSGAAEVWLGWQEYMPGDQLATIWYGPTLTQENRDAGMRFMLAYQRGVQQYNEGKTDRNVELMAEFTQLEPEEARLICWPSFSSDGSINFRTVQDFQQWAVEKGSLDDVLSVEEYWDGDFLEYANQALE